MMLVTATVGPLIVSRSAISLPIPETTPEAQSLNQFSLAEDAGSFTVVVPIYNPRTEQYLVELAASLAQRQQGRIVPLAITLARPHMNRQHLATAMARSEELLAKARQFSQSFAVQVNPLLRIDDQVPLAIYRASQEQRADLIVMGCSNTGSLRARLVGNIVDSVFGAAPCPVAVANLKQSPQSINRILVPVENFSERAVRMVSFAHLLTAGIQADMTLLHVVGATLGEGVVQWAQAETAALINRAHLPEMIQTRIVQDDDVVRAIVQAAHAFDLVILHSQRSQAAAEGFGFSSITSQVLRHLETSTIVLGEPHWEEG